MKKVRLTQSMLDEDAIPAPVQPPKPPKICYRLICRALTHRLRFSPPPTKISRKKP